MPQSCPNMPDRKTTWDLILDFAGIAGAVLLVLAFLPPLIRPESMHEEQPSASDYLRFFGMVILALSNTTQFIITTKTHTALIKNIRKALGIATPLLVGGSTGTATMLQLPAKPFPWITQISIATPVSFLSMGLFKLVLVSCNVKHDSNWNVGILLLAQLGIAGIGVCSYVGDETQLEHVQESLSTSFDVQVKLILALFATGLLEAKPLIKSLPFVIKAAENLGLCCRFLGQARVPLLPTTAGPDDPSTQSHALTEVNSTF